MTRKKPTERAEVALLDPPCEHATVNASRRFPGAIEGLDGVARDHARVESQGRGIACLGPGRAAITVITAAKDHRQLPVTEKMKNQLIALIPNLRAFAFSLCGHQERADDRGNQR